MASPDEVIRRYLRHLRDPDSDEQVRALRERLDASDDPVERLLLRAQIDRARGSGALEEGFVAAVREWSQQQDVDPAVFLEEGVPRDVLVRAGLIAGRSGRAARAGRSSRSVATRRPRVTADEVWAAIPDEDPFTLRELQEATGASVATVRKVVTEEAAAGNIAEVGPEEDHRGRGRAPTRYRWVGETG